MGGYLGSLYPWPDETPATRKGAAFTPYFIEADQVRAAFLAAGGPEA